jgi:hypothetical protein
MKKDQLFKKHPSNELFLKILSAFGLIDLNDNRSFTRKDLKTLRTVEKLELILDQLKQCYLPCKSRTYLSGLTEKNSVTVLRQILKTRNYTVLSREKYMRGEKFIIYSLTPLETKVYNPILGEKKIKKQNISNEPILITFD